MIAHFISAPGSLLSIEYSTVDERGVIASALITVARSIFPLMIVLAVEKSVLACSLRATAA